MTRPVRSFADFLSSDVVYDDTFKSKFLYNHAIREVTSTYLKEEGSEIVKIDLVEKFKLRRVTMVLKETLNYWRKFLPQLSKRLGHTIKDEQLLSKAK